MMFSECVLGGVAAVLAVLLLALLAAGGPGWWPVDWLTYAVMVLALAMVFRVGGWLGLLFVVLLTVVLALPLGLLHRAMGG